MKDFIFLDVYYNSNMKSLYNGNVLDYLESIQNTLNNPHKFLKSNLHEVASSTIKHNPKYILVRFPDIRHAKLSGGYHKVYKDSIELVYKDMDNTELEYDTFIGFQENSIELIRIVTNI